MTESLAAAPTSLATGIATLRPTLPEETTVPNNTTPRSLIIFIHLSSRCEPVFEMRQKPASTLPVDDRVMSTRNRLLRRGGKFQIHPRSNMA
jgi:hypothetical protein